MPRRWTGAPAAGIGGRGQPGGAPARRRTSPANWTKPRRWNRMAQASGRRVRVFCASMADVFDNAVPTDWRDDLFDLIRETPHLDWILLTKRIGNVAVMLPDDWGNGWPHVWLLITTVNQVEANRDIPKLLDIPATVHGLSIEPQLGPVDLTDIVTQIAPGDTHHFDALDHIEAAQYADEPGSLPALDWVICGAESGPGRRPFDEDWARQLRDQCQAAGVPFFYKQRINGGRKLETPELDGQQHIAWPETSGNRPKGNGDE